jgi:DNA recombination protein RmuC
MGMDPVVVILLVFVALAAGVALGWLVGRGRSSALAEERGKAIELLRMTLDEVEKERDAERARANLAAEDLATLRANAENFEKQKLLLMEAQESLKKEFENAGNRVLEKAQEVFLARAQERFDQSEEKNAERIKTLLAPVGERLKSYEEQVTALEVKRVDAFGHLHGQIEAMRVGQEEVRKEAARLGNSLRNAPKARGRWGEQQLRNVLEQCGLAEHTDFVTEHSVATDEGRLRPDAIVRIPGNKVLVIDAKVSLNDYQDAYECSDDATREACMDRHLSAMKNHIQTLASKSYQSQFEEVPDYVLMFVPGEHFITAALEQDTRKRANALEGDALLRAPDLWNYAFERRVLLASPTNLVAIARTIAQVWRQDGLAKEAREIGKLASDLYDSLAKTQDDLGKTGIHLGRAINSFNDFARTYDGNVLSRARRLAEKHIKIGKREISDEVPHVEIAPRRSETGLLPDAAEDPAVAQLSRDSAITP